MAERLLDTLSAHTTSTRPASACVLHSPPAEGRPWALADDGYRTCEHCLERVRQQLKDIRDRYLKLDPSVSTSSDDGSTGRGAPGFGSRAPANPHIVAMIDRRSKTCEVSWDAALYEGWVRDPDNGGVVKPLPPGVHGPAEVGVITCKRDVWFGSDGRPHSEPSNPPRSIRAALDAIAGWVAEERGVRPPHLGPRYRVRWPHTRLEWVYDPKRTPYPLPKGVQGPQRPPGRWLARVESRPSPVRELVEWLDRHLNWITRQEWVSDFAEQVRNLHTLLLPVTGDPRIWVAKCPNIIYPDGHATECGANLYYPLQGDTIRCGNPACRRPWTRDKWTGDSPDCLSQLVKLRRERTTTSPR